MLVASRGATGLVRTVIGALLAALAAGCVALRTDQVALDQARAAVEQARSAPRVRALAPAELDLAEVALQQAEAAALEGAPASHVDHLAYVASRQADRELGRIVERLRLEPGRAVSIEADFDLPDPAARTAMERRIELIRATLLRRGIEPSRIIVRASPPREEPAAVSSDQPAS